MSQGDENMLDPDTAPTLDPDEIQSLPSGGPGTKKQLGPYRILEEIGRGGMGVVYKAFHPQLKRTVALKVLIAGEDASEEAILRFHREAEAVAKLGHHPHIVPVYDIGRAGRLHYFAMHFVEGRSLDRIIDEGEIAPKRAAVITKKLAEALHHAHQHGVLHRDIKPANVLMAFTRLEGEPKSEIPNPKSQIPNINGKKMEGSAPVGGWDLEVGGSAREGGEPMLTDFGLAKDVESESQMTRSGVTLGTPQYMPPEQADGRVADIDERSDVYSLGATLYEMLTSHPPFEGAQIMEVIRKVLSHDPVSPRKGNPKVSRDLETICLKCLEKNPDRRYADAVSLAEDLGHLLEGAPILARPVSTLEKLGRKVRRHRGIFVTAVIASVLLLAGGVLAVHQITRSRMEKTLESERATKAEEGRGEAEADRRKAEIRLDRNSKVAAVLLGAFGQLGAVHRDLKKQFYDKTKTPEEKRKAYEIHRKKIELFGERIPEDSASKAAHLAVRGWLLRLGGFESEGKALLEEAKNVGEDVAWAYLFEAMTELSAYLGEVQVPAFAITPQGLKFGGTPPETEAMARIWGRFMKHVEGLKRATIWGGDQGDALMQVLPDLAGLRKGDPVAAEKALTFWRSAWQMAWMEEEILLARGKSRFMQENYEGAISDLNDYSALCPKSVSAHQHLAVIFVSQGAEAEGRGEDPTAFFKKAVNISDEAITITPHNPYARHNRAMALTHWADTEYRTGRDPRNRFVEAIQEYSMVIGLDRGEDPSLYSWRGGAYISLAKARQDRGEDPKGDFQKGIDDLTTALKGDPDKFEAYRERASAYHALGTLLFERGEDASEAFAKAIEDCDEVVRRKERPVGALVTRAAVYNALGIHESDRDRLARSSFDRAVEDATKALRLNSRAGGAHLYRGLARRAIAEVETAEGKDPTGTYRKSLEDLEEAIRRDPRDAWGYLGKAIALVGLAGWRIEQGVNRGDELERALEACKTVLDKNPADLEARSLRA
ncbi:MAG: protein kinase domain-containing protein, partial [Planctomycetota bacterium]